MPPVQTAISHSTPTFCPPVIWPIHALRTCSYRSHPELPESDVFSHPRRHSYKGIHVHHSLPQDTHHCSKSVSGILRQQLLQTTASASLLSSSSSPSVPHCYITNDPCIFSPHWTPRALNEVLPDLRWQQQKQSPLTVSLQGTQHCAGQPKDTHERRGMASVSHPKGLCQPESILLSNSHTRNLSLSASTNICGTNIRDGGGRGEERKGRNRF